MTPTQTLKDESKPPPNPSSTPKNPNLTTLNLTTPNLTTPKTLILPNNSDQDIDIINSPSNLGETNTIKDEDLDKTECSSSFGDTLSGTCSEINHEMSDSEVESPFARLKEDAALSDFIPRLYKKKKVTSHWRKYISPLMFRCQWLELRIKEIQNQASKYEKELAFIKQEKEVHSRMIELDRSCSRIVPFTSKFRSKKAMKRKKRKRDEDSKDGLRYMEDHVVFSYYENKKPETDGHSVNDDCPDPVEETTKANEESEFVLSPNCSDNFYIKVLVKIDSLQSRVQTLKSKLSSCTARRLKRPSPLLINNVINGNNNNNNNNQSPCIIQVNGNNNHNNNNNGDDNNIVNNNNGVSEDDDVADGGLPGSAVSSFGDAADVAALEASSRCPFADVAHMQHLCKEEIMEDVLIDNQAIAGEQYRHPIEMRQVSFIKTEPSEESTAPISPTSKEEHTSHSDQDLSLKPNQNSNLNLNLKTNSGLFLKRCYTGKRRGRRPNKNFGISGSVSGNVSGNGSDVNKGIKGKRSGMVMLASTSSGRRSERVKKPKIRD